MNAITRTHPGHWAHKHDAAPVDTRVSRSEQEDHQAQIAETGKVLRAFFLLLLVGIPSVWAAAGYLIKG